MHRATLTTLTFLTCCVLFSCGADLLMRFQGPPVKSYAKFGATLPELHEFTLCYWLKLHKKNSKQTTVFSYAGRKEPDMVVTWQNHTEKGPSTVGMDIAGGAVVMTLNLDNGNFFGTGQWQHICYGWSSYERDGFIALGGCKQKFTKVKISKQDEVVIKSGGVIILGQDQDDYGGGFQNADAFSGDVFGLHLWDEKLHTSKLQEAHICGKSNGNVLSWMEHPLEMHTVTLRKTEVCNLGAGQLPKCFYY